MGMCNVGNMFTQGDWSGINKEQFDAFVDKTRQHFPNTISEK